MGIVELLDDIGRAVMVGFCVIAGMVGLLLVLLVLNAVSLWRRRPSLGLGIAAIAIALLMPGVLYMVLACMTPLAWVACAVGLALLGVGIANVRGARSRRS
jgi:hypothetical protein